MRRRGYFLLSIIVFLFVASVGLLIFWLRPAAPKQTQLLPDGRVATLEAVTYGNTATMSSGIFGSTHISSNSGSNSPGDPLVFWLSMSSGSWEPFTTTQDVASDEHGCWMSQASGGGRTTQIGKGRWLGFEFGGTADIKLVTLAAYPRRGNSVTVRLFDNRSQRPIAEFMTPNPDSGPHPVWRPEPLPVTKKDGDLSITLSELRSGMNSHDGAAVPGEVVLTRTAFRISQGGKPSKEWAPAKISLSDATGNEVSEEIHRPLNEQYDYKGSDAVIRIQRMLCLEEVWKLRVELSRTEQARYAEDELWRVRGVSVPGRDSINRSTESTQRQGKTLRLVGIGGAGYLEWVSGYTSSGDRSAEVRARLSLPCDGMRLTLIATDERGRRYIGSVVGYNDFVEDNEREFSYTFFKIPPDAGRLDLTFAISNSRFVEFIAKPEGP